MSGRTPEQILAEFGAELERARPRRTGSGAAVALVVLLAVVAAWTLTGTSPEREITATPTPVITVTPAPDTTPAPATWPLKVDPPARDGSETKVMRATPLDVVAARKQPAALADLRIYGSGATLERAWSVPDLKGDVYLVRVDGVECLSIPDPATDSPQAERARSCGSRSLMINYVYVGLDLRSAAAPEIRFPDGHRKRVGPGELVALARIPPGSSVTLFPRDSKPHTDRVDGGPFQWHCPDDRRVFWLLPRQLKGPEPCSAPPNRTGG